MRLEPVPVLKVLRDLWSMPRDMARFRAYLEQVKAGAGGEMLLPIVAANPMAREHMVRLVDALDAMGAERIVSDACREAERRLAHVDLARRVSLVPVDDVGGAWSERSSMDFDNRFGLRKMKRDYGWSTAFVYASETVAAPVVRERVLASVYRAAWTRRHGQPETLAAMLRQEGAALRFAGATAPLVPDVEAVRRTLAPHLGSTVHATRFAAMYGDAAARRCGHQPLGVPDDAGFALALADAPDAPEGET